jgi:chromosome partitioning protein
MELHGKLPGLRCQYQFGKVARETELIGVPNCKPNELECRIPKSRMEANRVGRILCVANQKGGVGKTTTAVNLSAALARSGAHVLLVDLDPQCNATTGIGAVPSERHALIGSGPIRDHFVELASENYVLLPGSRSFEDVDVLMREGETDSARLERHLRDGIHGFDYVLIDCPPSLGALTQTALAASTEVLMPIQCEYFAMEGLTQMIHIIRKVMADGKGRLKFGGILLTMYEPGLKLTEEVDEEVREFFGDIVFDTVVPRDVALAEAPSHGRSVLDYAPRSRGARAYLELCMEVMEL